MEAAIWNGLVFHMKRKKIGYGGEIGDKERLLPTEFKGVAGEGGIAKPASTPAAASTPTAPTATETAPDAGGDGGAADGLSGKLKIALRKLAKEVKASGGDHDAFAEKAFELDGVDGNSAAENAVMNDGDGSIWASAE